MKATVLKMRMLFETGDDDHGDDDDDDVDIVALVVSLERAQSTQLVGSDSSLWLRRHLHSTHSYTIGYIGHITESSTIYKWYNHFLSNVLCTSLQDYFNPFSTCTSSSLKP